MHHRLADVGTAYEIAETYVSELADLDPYLAAVLGVQGHDAELTNHSPEAIEGRVALARRTIAQLRDVAPDTDAARVCRDFMLERLDVIVDSHQLGEDWRPLFNVGSPVQTIRETFDLCPLETEEVWHRANLRMARVSDALLSLEATLRRGLALGLPAGEASSAGVRCPSRHLGRFDSDRRPFFLNSCGCVPVR